MELINHNMAQVGTGFLENEGGVAVLYQAVEQRLSVAKLEAVLVFVYLVNG